MLPALVQRVRAEYLMHSPMERMIKIKSGKQGSVIAAASQMLEFDSGPPSANMRCVMVKGRKELAALPDQGVPWTSALVTEFEGMGNLRIHLTVHGSQSCRSVSQYPSPQNCH